MWKDTRPDLSGECVYLKGDNRVQVNGQAKKNFKDLSYTILYCMSL